MFYNSKRTLTPPLNPPKARHSSGKPWESLWEGLGKLWEAQGQLWETLGEGHSGLGRTCCHHFEGIWLIRLIRWRVPNRAFYVCFIIHNGP